MLIFTTKKIKKIPARPLMVMFGSFVGLCLVSALVHGAPKESIIGVLRPIGILLWIIMLGQKDYGIESALMVSGAVTAIVGLINFGLSKINVSMFDGSVVDGRIYGTFQYANAYAIYLAVCGFVGCHHLSGALRKVKIVTVVIIHLALFLTFSVGAIGVYALGWLMWLWRNNRRCFYWAAVTLPIVTVIVFAIAGLRPVSTYFDRLLQISDALLTASQNLFGIGPGRWQFEVYERQTSFYSATVIHSGYAEVAAEVGFPALVLVIALIIYYIRTAQYSDSKIAVMMILIHAVFDFSLSFFSITLALLALSAKDLINKEAIVRLPIRYRILFALPLVLAGVSLFRQGAVQMPMDKYRLDSEAALRDNNIPVAAEMALLSIEHAPYQDNTYEWANALVPVLAEGERETYLLRLSTLKADADRRQNPLAPIAQKIKQIYLSTREVKNEKNEKSD